MNVPEIKKLGWDSGFFGYPVGEISFLGPATDMVPILQRARQAGYHLIYLKSATPLGLTPDLPAGMVLGVQDHKIYYLQPLPATGPTLLPFNFISVYPANAVNPALVQLALTCGQYSRFARDPYFKQQEYYNLYTHWMQAAVAGTLADVVWVSTTPNGTLTGMLTLKKVNKKATIGLLAVLPEHQNQGYGQKLVQTAVIQARSWGCTEIGVGTQAQNLPANQLYQKNNFRPAQSVFTTHFWLQQP